MTGRDLIHPTGEPRTAEELREDLVALNALLILLGEAPEPMKGVRS